MKKPARALVSPAQQIGARMITTRRVGIGTKTPFRNSSVVEVGVVVVVVGAAVVVVGAAVGAAVKRHDLAQS